MEISMKVSGFTFIKNGVRLDYPFVEAIQSILPICDEVVVAVGASDDDTLEVVKNIDPKIRVIETVWDESLREGGAVLAEETNKAFKAIDPEADWAFYIQGDEVIHEQYLDQVKSAMEAFKEDEKVDGLLFKYAHFYGSYDYIGASENWYRNEIRVIKNNPKIYSYRDAQGFRKDDNQKLNVKAIDAYMYHYGWVKKPEAMQQKQEEFNKLWHDDEWVAQNVVKADAFDYEAHVNLLKKFEGTHPQVMEARLKRLNWTFEYDISTKKRKLKDSFKFFLRNYLGLDFSYKNYNKV